MNAEILSEEMQKRPPTELVTVRMWQGSAAAEGRWGSVTKCGVTESMTVCRPSRVLTNLQQIESLFN